MSHYIEPTNSNSHYGSLGRTTHENNGRNSYRIFVKKSRSPKPAIWTRQVDVKLLRSMFEQMFLNEGSTSWTMLQELLADASTATFEEGEFAEISSDDSTPGIHIEEGPYLIAVEAGPHPTERFCGVVRVIAGRPDKRVLQQVEKKLIESFPFELILDTNNGPISTKPAKLVSFKGPNVMEVVFFFRIFKRDVEVFLGDVDVDDLKSTKIDLVLESPIA